MTRAAIYTRISQDRTGAALGVERQQGDCLAMAKREDWDVVAVLVDNDKSAYKGKKRPDYERLLEMMRTGAVDRVVAWHPDRLHRSLTELQAYIDASGQNIETHFVQAGRFDLASASGRMNARMLGVVAQAESEHKAERIRRKQQQSTEAGVWIGGTRPFGWRIKKGGIPEVDEAEAAMIRNAAERLIEGGSLGSIIREWNAAGVLTTTGKQWSYATLKQMLTRTRNVGVIKYGDTEGEWPPILDEGTWRATCALLSDPARRRSSSNLTRWLLAGIAKCECGATVRSAGVRSRQGDTVPIYRCRETGPGHVHRRAREADELVELAVLDNLDRLENERALRAKKEVTPSGVTAVSAAARVRELRAEADQAAAMVAGGEMTLSQLRILNQKILPELAKLEEQMAVSKRTSVLAAFLSGDEDAGDVWDRADIEVRRELVRATVDVTFLRTDRKAGRVFDPNTVKIDFKAPQ